MLSLQSKITQQGPLTPWELPSLLAPMHRYRQSRPLRPPHDRPHYPALLAFLYKNKYAVASQFQRRFPGHLRSSRTARRHLAEMQHLGYVDIVPTRNTSPLWPKVYYVTGRGHRRLKQAFSVQGKIWHPVRRDRKSRHRQEGLTADHVVHELLITELLLAVWLTIQRRRDLELLTMHRRSLARHPAFRFELNGRVSRLIPDALFMFRQDEGAMVVCLLELDNGEMNKKSMQTKFWRYEAWAKSDAGQRFLTSLYRQHGATDPKSNFRLIIVADDRSDTGGMHRLHDILRLALEASARLRDRLWLTAVCELRKYHLEPLPLGEAIWRRGKDARSWARKGQQTSLAWKAAAAQTAGLPLHPLFPLARRRKMASPSPPIGSERLQAVSE